MSFKKVFWASVLLALLWALTGCGQSGAGNGDSPAKLDGIWTVSSYDGAALPLFSERDLSFLEFDSSQDSVTIYGTHSGTDAVHACVKTIASYSLNDVFTLRLDGGCCMQNSFTYRYELQGDKLILYDLQGRGVTLSRFDGAGAAWQNAQCKSLTYSVEPALGLQAEPLYASNLVSDGNNLMFMVNNNLYTVDPSDWHTVSHTVMAGNYTHLLTTQGNLFWTHSQSGHDNDVKLVDASGASSDTVDTSAFSHHEIMAGAGVYIPASGLWLYGPAASGGGEYQLLQIDSDAEPDTLTATTYFYDLAIRALTSYNGHIWGLLSFHGAKLVEIDPSNGAVMRVFDLPPAPANGRYKGIAALGSSFYLMISQSSPPRTYIAAVAAPH